MKIIFDFDHTLYDMMAMHQAIEEAMAGLGISQETYYDAYTRVTNWKAFTVAALAQQLSRQAKVREQDVVDALEQVVKRSAEWLYPDVIDGLLKLSEAGHELYLLTWGDMEWQMKKIRQCDIMSLFREVISITQIKADYLKAWRQDGSERVMLIDDKPAELKMIEATGQDMELVRMRRPGAKYSDQETPQGMAEATNMDDILRFVARS